jgi:RND family efflux transporter MFP subunit
MKVLVTFVVIVVVLIGCEEKVRPGSAPVNRRTVTGVVLTKVSASEANLSYETSGTVVAKAVSVIGARTMGTVTSVKVREGDWVRQGQELATVDDRDLAQRVAASEFGYREAEKALEEADQNRRLADVTYQRYKNLFNDQVITRQEMDQMETQRRVADLGYERAREATNRVRAQLEEARIGRGFSRVVAPGNGLIVSKKIEEGSLAAPGSPLFLLEDTSRYRVEAAVDQRMAATLKIGTATTVQLPTGNRVGGTVGEIVPAIDPSTRSFVVRIDVRDSSLRSGLYVKVSIPDGKTRLLLVPKKAVVEKGQLTGVYVVDSQDVMTYRMVRTGRVFGERIEVLSGLRDGENVVTGGVERAVDGGRFQPSGEAPTRG